MPQLTLRRTGAERVRGSRTFAMVTLRTRGMAARSTSLDSLNSTSTAKLSAATPVALPDDSMNAVKLELLKKVACLNRGAIATSNDRYEVSTFVDMLEESAGVSHSDDEGDASSSTPSVNVFNVQGRWELLYSSVEQFRSSPFFWAFQEGLVQNRDISAEIFRFTDALPGAHVGAVFQTISFDMGKLISEVDLTVFPGIKGTLVTTSLVEPELPNKLSVTVESTRVSNSNLLPFIDTITVPVQQIFEQIRGAGATTVQVEITYLDEDLRIARTRPDNQTFIYRRV